MRATNSVEVSICNAEGRIGVLSIDLPPSSRRQNAVPELFEDEAARELERVQLIEGGEYRYQVRLDHPAKIAMEPREVISPDDDSGLTGRLRPGLYVGRLLLQITSDGRRLGDVAVEVRSRKLDYLRQYRQMLSDVASIAAELALQRFAASEQRMTLDVDLDATTLYQRFCFLKNAILGERLALAFATINARPFVEWDASAEPTPPNRGIRGSPLIARAMARASVRTAWPNRWHPIFETLPAMLPATRFASSRDNVPNRFVRFVLEQWSSTINEIKERLHAERRKCVAKGFSVPAPVLRGLIEVEEVIQALERYFDAPVLRGVARLTRFPGANQVLQRRAGYREIRELYALSEFAGIINWDGAEDVFGAGQRNVATLYEYWVFIQIAMIVRDVTNGSVRLDELFKARGDDLVLMLKQEKASTLSGFIERHGVRMNVELSFNRSFASSVSGGSWTRTMKPDCSLVLTPVVADPLVEPVSLHFDAKYSVHTSRDVLGHADAEANPDDLIKMHAYRDAILQAVGAYVIFPGDANEPPFRKYSELVPGLGAFSMTPSSDGAIGARAVQAFLEDVIEHIATRGTRRARATYWRSTAYRGAGSKHPGVPGWLTKPPADTIVLFGYVKSEEHLQWIRQNGLYNLRADDRRGAVGLDSAALRADVLLTYGPCLGESVQVFRVGDRARVVTAHILAASGYPEPRSTIYFCLPVIAVAQPPRLTALAVRALQRHRSTGVEGAPFCASFLELLNVIRD